MPRQWVKLTASTEGLASRWWRLKQEMPLSITSMGMQAYTA
jgi:hypothetical protein